MHPDVDRTWRSGAEAAVAPPPHGAVVLAVAAGIVAAAACIVALAAARPDLRPLLLDEDELVEWGSVLAYYGAFGVAAVRLREGRVGRDLLLAAVAAFALLAALDELSFGERLLGWQPPEVMGTKLDGAHDLAMIAKKAILRWAERPYLVAGLLAAAAAAGAGAALAILARRGRRPRLGAEAWLLALAAAMLATAQAADLNLQALGSRVLGPLGAEEVLEMGAGLALLGFALLRGAERARGPGRRRTKAGSVRPN